MSPKPKQLEQLIDAFSNMKHILMTRYSHLQQTGKLGLSSQQIRILMLLSESGGSTVKELANKARITPGAITQFVDQLEQKGLVARKTDSTDRRISHLSMAPEAREHYQSIRQENRKLLGQFFACLNEAEIGQLTLLIQKLVTHNGELVSTNETETNTHDQAA